MNHQLPTQDDAKLIVRVPAALKQWLKSEAATNHRSTNGQLVHLLEQARRAQQEVAQAHR